MKAVSPSVLTGDAGSADSETDRPIDDSAIVSDTPIGTGEVAGLALLAVESGAEVASPASFPEDVGGAEADRWTDCSVVMSDPPKFRRSCDLPLGLKKTLRESLIDLTEGIVRRVVSAEYEISVVLKQD